ncbi:MAG TPA: hypothetical protein PLL60_02955, partial [Bacilli bacterium]|nr:hypothetical protein [Bacilli bacterium]
KRLLLVTFSFLSIGFMLGIIINTRIFWSLGGTLWFSFSLLATVLTFIFYLIWKKASIACYASSALFSSLILSTLNYQST